MDIGAQNGRIAYGATPKQVLTELGPPTAKQAGCWTYFAKAHAINGEYLGEFVDGLRYCFGDGPAGGQVVTTVHEHITAHRLPNKTWFPGGWGGVMTLMSPESEKLKF